MSDLKPQPGVSIVLPTHNRPDLLAEAIDSVRTQTYGNWRLIVVDDASDPPASTPADPRIELIRNTSSRGGAESKNIGASRASAEILAFLDDDDLYAPTYLERAIKTLSNNPEIDVVFMGVLWFGERGEAGQQAYDEAMHSLMDKVRPFSVQDETVLFESSSLFRGLLQTVPMAFQRPVLRRSILERIGPYQGDILLWDCDWAIRAALHAKCALVSDGLYLQRAAGQGFSSQQDRRAEHLRSNALMKKRLLQSPLTAQQRKSVSKAIEDLWFGAAWSNYVGDNLSLSLKYLWESAKVRPSLDHIKLLTRIFLRKLQGRTA